MLLRGVMDRLEEGPSITVQELTANNPADASLIPGSIVLTRTGYIGHLRLLPLFIVGKVYDRRSKKLAPMTDEIASQAYCRRGEWLEYTALHRYVGWGYAAPQYQERFEQLFPLSQWR